VPTNVESMASNNDVFCGGYLNPIAGQMVAGSVLGLFVTIFLQPQVIRQQLKNSFKL